MMVDSGRAAGFDQTELAREQLASSFISVVSHELQTPLAIIKAYASTLARRDANWSPEVLQEGLQAIEEEADRLSQLVNDLLTASRIQATGLTAARIPVDLPSLADRVVRRFSSLSDRHRYLIDFQLPIPTILADQEKLEIVLSNLLDNTTKYAPSGSIVRITGTLVGHGVQVSVQDEGPGIPPDAHERVFERFYRVDTSDTRGVPGAGLGLFICRAIVEAHGGRIWVEPVARRGTTICFSLPLPEEECQDAGPYDSRH